MPRLTISQLEEIGAIQSCCAVVLSNHRDRALEVCGRRAYGGSPYCKIHSTQTELKKQRVFEAILVPHWQELQGITAAEYEPPERSPTDIVKSARRRRHNARRRKD